MIRTKNKSGKSGIKAKVSGASKRPENTPRGQKDDVLFPQESEAANQREGADATFTERNDVTPPNKKEFPSVGAAKTDFESRPYGRTTGRMIGHEPGTEAI
ncbi:MAG: hypothetical protein ACXVI9_12195 [Mucilaginibacter sp.]